MADRTCAACGGSMAHRTSPKAIYCSKQCLDWNKHHPGVPLDRSAHKCRYCDKPLDQRKLDLRYCDRRCQHRGLHGTSQIPDVRQCKHCGVDFDVTHGHHVYCSRKCSSDATLPAWLEANRERNKQVRRDYLKRTGKGTEAVHRYLARKRDGEYEKFSNLEIFERDGWICQICSDPVDQALKWPHRMSPSLDHIIPVSKNGHHVRSNVQLAHLTCNIVKSDKVDQADALEA